MTHANDGAPGAEAGARTRGPRSGVLQMMADLSCASEFRDPDDVAGPVTVRQAVAWGELDALGHINHTVFLRWFENVRLRWFERVGITARMDPSLGGSGLGSGLGPILARIECDYRAPVRYPDTIAVNARCVELGRSSLTLANAVWSEQHAGVVAQGRVVVVLLDHASQRSVAIPEPVRAAIRALDDPTERGRTA
jgi:acyl-CoA thioester hydrolase